MRVITACVWESDQEVRRDKPELYADLAKAWIRDEVVEDNKAMRYYGYLVDRDKD